MATPEQIKHLNAKLSAPKHTQAHQRSLLKISDLSPAEVADLLAGGLREKLEPETLAGALSNVRVALLFQKTSTRTRCSFEIGTFEMSGWPVFIDYSSSNFGHADLRDEIRALARYFELIVARVYKQADLETMREFSGKPVINALSDDHHPCQGLADAMTMLEFFGSLKGLHLAWVGDGNNVLHSLLEVAALTGIELTIASPEGYQPDKQVLEFAQSRTKVRLTSNPREAVESADIVYTDTWVSLGDEAEAQTRLKIFPPYQLNEDLLAGAPNHALVMHCLPAHRGQEISAAAIELPNSIIFDQAENRKHLQNYLMYWLLRE